MAALQDKLNQPEFINWMKGGLVLKYMDDGLVNFSEKEVGALQHHICSKIREMRHKILHSENQGLEQEDLDNLIKHIKSVLQDPQTLLDCQEAKDAVNRISEMEREDFNVMCGDSIEHLHAYVRQQGIRQSQYEDQTKQFLKDCITKIKNEVTHSTENELGKLRNDLNQSNPKSEITSFQNQLRRVEEIVENIDGSVNERDKIMSIRNEIDIVRTGNESMRYLINEHQTLLETFDEQLSHRAKAIENDRNVSRSRRLRTVCKWIAMAVVLLVAHLLNNERTGRGPMRLI